MNSLIRKLALLNTMGVVEMKAKNVKISVLDKQFHRSVVEKYTEHADWKPCDMLEEGQEFVSEGGGRIPSGFCSWAWADIHKYAMALARGADFVGVKPGLFIACCTDGFRPVIFKLERI